MLSRFKRSAVLTAGALGLLTAVGLAFFVGSFLADGSHEGTVGSGGAGVKTLPIAVDFPSAQLKPGGKVALTAEVENTSSKSVTFTKVKPTVTTGAAGCEASWFSVVAEGSGAAKWNEAFAGTGPRPSRSSTRRAKPP